MKPPIPTPIYHITHVENLRNILAHGGLFSHRASDRLGLCCVDIGNREIKRDRDQVLVPCGPKGCIGDYVPFYFAPRSPMLYMIANGRVDGYDGREDDVIYLTSTAQNVADRELPFVFTDGHARKATSQFATSLGELNKVDWDVMVSRYWFDTNQYPDRKRRRQAEFLVYDHFPWELVSGIAAKSQTVKGRVLEIINESLHQPPVHVSFSWYYG